MGGVVLYSGFYRFVSFLLVFVLAFVSFFSGKARAEVLVALPGFILASAFIMVCLYVWGVLYYDDTVQALNFCYSIFMNMTEELQNKIIELATSGVASIKDIASDVKDAILVYAEYMKSGYLHRYDMPDASSSYASSPFEFDWSREYWFREDFGVYEQDYLWGELITRDMVLEGDKYIFVFAPYSDFRNFYIYDKVTGKLIYQQYVTSDYNLGLTFDPVTGATYAGFYDWPIGAVAIPGYTGVARWYDLLPYADTAVAVSFPATYPERDFPFPPLGNLGLDDYNKLLDALDKGKSKSATDSNVNAMQSALTSLVTGAGEGAVDYSGWLSGILGLLQDIWSFLQDVLNGILGVLSSIWEYIRSALRYISDTLSDILDWLESLFLSPTVEVDLSPLEGIIVSDKFPFCLPWDLMRSVQVLTSSPRVPYWELPIKGEKIVIDFSMFEPLARIVRFFVVLTFIVSLIILTRRLF